MTVKESQLRSLIREELDRALSEDEMEFQGDPNYGNRGEKINTYLFTVANNTEGRNRIKMAKDALSPFFTFRVRGRHHNRKEVLGSKYIPGRQNDIPLDKAEYLAVYAVPKR